MESLYLLLPMSVLLVLALIGLFAWALHAGQFDDLEREGRRVLEEREGPIDSAAPGAAMSARPAVLDSSPEADSSHVHNAGLKDKTRSHP